MNAECRICLRETGRLVHVCGCKGTHAFVHVDCINRWRFSFPKQHVRHTICNVCTQPYNVPEPFWSQSRIALWVHATTYSVMYLVIPVSAIVTTYPCLSYQVRMFSLYYKTVPPCNYQQLGWIAVESSVATVEYMVLTTSPTERGIVVACCILYLALCTLIAAFDATGVFMWLCFLCSMTLPCWTCCLLPSRSCI